MKAWKIIKYDSYFLINTQTDLFFFLCPAQPQIEKLDNYNRTPLKLAVMMGNREAAFELLRHGAKPDGMDAEGFSLYHYAILSRDVHLIAEMYRQREMSRLKLILSEIGKRFANFSKVPDFYYELKWEITGSTFSSFSQPRFTRVLTSYVLFSSWSQSVYSQRYLQNLQEGFDASGGLEADQSQGIKGFSLLTHLWRP